MPRKSSKTSPEVIDLVDSDEDESPITIVNDSNSTFPNLDFNVPVAIGAMVSTPYGNGQLIESRNEIKSKQQPRKRPRISGISSNDAHFVLEGFVSVQLTYGRASLLKSIVKPIFSPYQSDLMRCQPRMMFNDNIVNFVVKHMIKPDRDISVLSSYSLSMFRNRLNDTSSTVMKKRSKLQKLMPAPIDQLNYLVIPINADMHWSLVVICNLHKLVERVRLICKLKAEAISQIDLTNCTPTVKRAKVKQCLETFDLTMQLELQWTSDDTPCFMHLDSANMHRMQPVYVLLRKFLSMILDFNSNSSSSMQHPADDVGVVDIESTEEDIGPIIDALALPGMSVPVPQQVGVRKRTMTL
jgi:hypothetical protein